MITYCNVSIIAITFFCEGKDYAAYIHESWLNQPVIQDKLVVEGWNFLHPNYKI